MQLRQSAWRIPLREKLAVKNWRRSLSFGAADFGDSESGATNIGTLRRDRSYNYSDDVGRSDADYLRFRINRKKSPFSITLRNDSGNNEPIAVSILNKRGRVIKRDGNFMFANANVGETVTLTTRNMRKGIYQLRIQSVFGNRESYDLELALDYQTPSDGSDNAFNLGRLSSDRDYNLRGEVGGSDVDLYSFSVDDTSRIAASLTNEEFSSSLNDSIAFSILDDQRRTVQTDNGRFLFANINPRASDMLFAPTLPEGEYYIRIQSEFGRDLNYGLTLRKSSLDVIPL